MAAYIIIWKSFWRNLKPKSVIMAIIFCGILFLVFYKEFRLISSESEYRQAAELYGTYQVVFGCPDRDTLEALRKDDRVIGSAAVIETYTVDQYAYKQYCEETLFGIANYRMLSGRFPQNAGEVLCEKRYLVQEGIDFAEDQDVRINVGGESYRVVGTFSIKEADQIYGFYYPRFLFNIESWEPASGGQAETYLLYCETDINDSYSGIANTLAQEYNLNAEQYSYNWDTLAYRMLDENNHETNVFFQLCDLLYWLILVMLAILAVTIISIVSRKWEDTIRICQKLGIGRTLLILALFTVSMLPVWIMSAAVFILSAVVNVLLGAMWNLAECSMVTVQIAGIIAVYDGIVSICIAGPIWKRSGKSQICRKEKKQNLKKKPKLPYEVESILMKSRHPFLQMAKYDMQWKRWKRFITGASLALAFALVSCFAYSMKFLNLNRNEFQYDYRVDFTYGSLIEMFDGTEENEEKYQELLQLEDRVQIDSIYRNLNMVSIKVSSLSDEYVEYLERTDVYALQRLSRPNGSGTYQTQFVIIGADEEMLTRLYLSEEDACRLPGDDTCILVRNIAMIEGDYVDTGFSKGEIFDIDYDDPETGSTVSLSLTAEMVVEDITFPTADNCGYPILIVSMDNFKTIMSQKYLYPQMIYLKTMTGDTDEIEEFFKGASGMVLKDLREEQALYDRQIFTVTCAVYGMCGILTLILIAQMFLCMKDKLRVQQRQIAALGAIGIPVRYSMLQLIYEYFDMLLSSMICGLLLSLAGCYGIYLYVRRVQSYFHFSIPYLQLLVPAGVLVVSFLLCICPVMYGIKRIPILKTLQSE